MAGRIVYRKILRQIHLVSSMVILAFLLMYFVTGFILIRHSWFPHGEPEIITQAIPFKVDPETTNFEALTKTIKKQLKISGREDKPVMRKDSCWIYNIYKPGISYQVILNPETDSLSIRTSEQFTVARVSSRLHLMRHYKGGFKYIVWAIFYDLASVSMLVFGVTGILIWMKMGRAFKNGIYYLIAGIAFTAGVLIYLVI